MIFDNEQAIKAYIASESGNPNDLAKFCELCQGLIEVTALSISPTHKADLVQEANEKLLIIVLDRIFNPKLSNSMYSFLSVTFRNVMISYLRKERRVDGALELSEDLVEAELSSRALSTNQDVAEWAVARFPSYPEEVNIDAARYVVNALDEDVNDKSRGIRRMLQLWYNLDKAHATCFYYSVACYYKFDDKSHRSDALRLIESNLSSKMEKSMLPEVVLVVGLENALKLMKALRGAYVRL